MLRWLRRRICQRCFFLLRRIGVVAFFCGLGTICLLASIICLVYTFRSQLFDSLIKCSDKESNIYIDDFVSFSLIFLNKMQMTCDVHMNDRSRYKACLCKWMTEADIKHVSLQHMNRNISWCILGISLKKLFIFLPLLPRHMMKHVLECASLRYFWL